VVSDALYYGQNNNENKCPKQHGVLRIYY